MTEHRSHPDQLMASALGVCWHSPTSDRWACSAVVCTDVHGSGESCTRPAGHGGQHHTGGPGLGWES
jgi:hypothetical protein